MRFCVSDVHSHRDIERMTRPADDHDSLLTQVGDEVLGVASFERLDEDPTAAEFGFGSDRVSRPRHARRHD